MVAAEEVAVFSEMEARVRGTELLISNLLRAGVLLSIALVLTGVGVMFAHNPAYFTSSSEMATIKSSSFSFPTSLPAVVRGIGHFEGRALVMAGLLVLIATPVMRVAVSILAFIHLRDRTFVVITSTVLTLLLVSLFLGKAGG